MKKTLTILLSLLMLFVFTATCMASAENAQMQSTNKVQAHQKIKKAPKQEKQQKSQNETEDIQKHENAPAIKTSGSDLKSDNVKTQDEITAATTTADEDVNNNEVVNNENTDSVPEWAKGYAKKNAKLGFFNRFHSKMQVAKAEAVVVLVKTIGLEPADVSDMNFGNVLISKDDAGYIKALWLKKITFTRSGIAALLEGILSNDEDKSDNKTNSDNAIESVSIEPQTSTIGPGKSVTLKATVKFADETTDNNVTWTSSDTSLAAVDENGVVTAASDKTGTATITATAVKDGITKTASCEVEVAE